MQRMQISNRGLFEWCERAIIGCIFLIAVFAPHSIAATQTAWLLGLVFWLLRFAFYPRRALFRTPVDYLLFGFFVLSGVSCVFSYSPFVSIGKMRAASLFTIVYLVAQNVRSLRLVHVLALTLIGSCMVNVLLTAGQLVVGRGVKVEGVKAESPLAKAVFRTKTVTQATPIRSGDTISQIDGKPVSNPDELAAALAGGSPVGKVKIYRVEWTPELEVPRGSLLPGNNALDQLGITGWSRGRDWRASGFFGHWVTYAEVLQLIASLAFGMFLFLPQKKSLLGLFLAVSVIGLVFALAMTVTRAAWIGFAISAALILALSVSRRTLLIAAACVIPLVVGSVILLQQKRNVGFIDSADQSTSWREMVWREGFELLVSKPRHLLGGVGMDSIKGHWREWGLFDNGRQPIGHMHSNVLQIALERGVPALIVWLLLLGVYGWVLLGLVRKTNLSEVRGIALGALGGLAGFFVSGLVHYNWGDSEVVTVFYFIMGLSLVLERSARDQVQTS
ncbi:MAG: O-antigen ligase family protein [Acidobacteria bacterium]|nr:O-antigen ligase family protein [Acidobacteriota bacterium]MCA1627802.1 O-antigen ligase family protein [Acidobacteriota bacterium]